ncbi:MAG: Bug family tripartite tricarboxylate transporter substrate binding protein [Pigmentiphaga sp.]
MKTTQKPAWILAFLLAAGAAQAQTHDGFPNKPIRWIVGTSAGGGTDVVTRTIAQQLQEQLGQTIVVENKPGGGTTIAADYVSRSPADGYTMLTADVGTIVFNTALFKSLSYDPLNDFAGVGTLASVPLLLAVRADNTAGDAKELLAAMRKNPEQFSVATAGIGSPHHIALEFLKDQAKLDVLHIPYKGSAPAIQDVLGGVTPVMVVDIPSGMSNIKAGKLKALATFTAERLPSLPDVPSLVELGVIEREPSSWWGIVVPKKTPSDVVAKLSAELEKAIRALGVQERLKAMGVEPLPSDSAQMDTLWRRDMDTWPPLIREKEIRLD